MRIHTDNLTEDTIRDAARLAGVGLYRCTTHGSRKRARAFDVILEGSGRTGTRYGQNADMIAATWDEWGIFLAALFRADDTVTIPRVYEDAEHFRWTTGARYDDLVVADQHIRHRWDYSGTHLGAYSVRQCRCGAVHRWLVGGRTWATWADQDIAVPAPVRTDDRSKYESNGRYAADLAAAPVDLIGRIDALIGT